MIGIDLRGRTALVTGASNGIGLATSHALSECGARVIGIDIASPERDFPGTLIEGDVTNPRVRADALALITEPSRAILINNAALQLEMRFSETSAEQVRRTLEVNVVAALQLVLEFTETVKAGGSIVNMASILGLTGDPGLAAYSVSKGAVVNMTRSLALELAGRFRVNAVCPGAIRTPLTTRVWDLAPDPSAAEAQMNHLYPADRIGEPEEVAHVVAFLCSDLAAFVNGTCVVVDGGLLAANAEWGLERLT